MKYIVVNEFIDTKDNNRLYEEVGKPYPHPDSTYKPTEERIKELSTVHPKYKRIFIAKAPDDQQDDNNDVDLLSEADIKKMNKAQQEEVIKGLGGNVKEVKNEEERIALILKLQDENKDDQLSPSEQK